MIAIEPGIMARQKNYLLIASLALFGISLIVWVLSLMLVSVGFKIH